MPRVTPIDSSHIRERYRSEVGRPDPTAHRSSGSPCSHPRRSSSSSLASCLPSLLVSQGSAACRHEQRETVAASRSNAPAPRTLKSAALFFVTLTGPKAPMATSDVLIFDTTLRDGEQAPGNSLTPEEKLRLARQLDALGVDIIEAGFPAASEGDYRSVREIAAEVRRPVIAALARCYGAGHRPRRRGARPAPSGPGSTSSSRPPTSTCGRSSGWAGTRWSSGPGPPSAGRGGTPTTWSSPPRTRAGPIPTSSAGWCRPRSRRAPPRSTSPTPSATRCPRSTPRCSATCWRRVPGADRVILSAHCHDDLGLAVGQFARRDRGRRPARSSAR